MSRLFVSFSFHLFSVAVSMVGWIFVDGATGCTVARSVYVVRFLLNPRGVCPGSVRVEKS